MGRKNGAVITKGSEIKASGIVDVLWELFGQGQSGDTETGPFERDYVMTLSSGRKIEREFDE